MTDRTTKPQKFSAIDLDAALDTIQSTYGDRYFAVPEALWEAAALWGVTPETGSINDCGVFTPLSDVLHWHDGRCKVEIRLVEAPNGYWAMSVSYFTATSGYASMPSVRNRKAFPTREDARLAAIDELIERLHREADSRCSAITDANRREIRQMIERLEAEKTPQLSLF